jgi:hypothetical protein
MCLYFRSFKGIFKFSSIEDPLAKKIKLQQTNVFYVHVPARIIEHMGFKKGQQFMFSSGPGYIKYNPYIEFSSNKLIGVAKKKEVPNNSGKYLEHKAEGLSINEDLQQMQN